MALLSALAVAAGLVPGLSPVDAQPQRRNVVLITLDGARTEEIFGGLDEKVLAATLKEGERLDQHPLQKQFGGGTPAIRRQKMMPFFWDTLVTREGSIAGNRALGSAVGLVNRHWFSYPGYAEIVLGVAHDERIKSNDPVRNPFPTVLEFLQKQLRLARHQVAVFASWDVFDAIVESQEGLMTVNAGFAPADETGDDVRRLNALQRETQTPWDSVRHDAYTFRFAMAHLARHKPQVVYLALGETDDWAHDGRYDRVLEAYARTDEYLRELWTWLQSQPEYRGSTNLLITTDHGRGRTPEDWQHHGDKYPGGGDTWMAFAGPAMSQRGEWRDHPRIKNASVAATMIDWMGLDWKVFNPEAAAPIQ